MVEDRVFCASRTGLVNAARFFLQDFVLTIQKEWTVNST